MFVVTLNVQLLLQASTFVDSQNCLNVPNFDGCPNLWWTCTIKQNCYLNIKMIFEKNIVKIVLIPKPLL